MAKKGSEEGILSSEGIRKLLAGGGDALSDEERALLVALIGVELETGREPSEEERAALEALIDQAEGLDVEAITQAVKRAVRAEADEERKADWSNLKDRFGKL
jgi:uncharacterized membrane protein